jgi:hypothetical protein
MYGQEVTRDPISDPIGAIILRAGCAALAELPGDVPDYQIDGEQVGDGA